MVTTTTATSIDTLSLLEQACARNVAADLHIEHPQQGILSARIRLLNLDDAYIYMNRPQVVGQKLHLRAGQSVEIFFLLSGTRYAFRTRIARSACYVRLNAAQQVPGVSVEIPKQVKVQQRRADFRLSLAVRHGISVLMHGGTRANGGSCSIDQPRVVGRLMNISAGGLGAQCDAQMVRRWQQSKIYFLDFRLPGTDRSAAMMATLQHIRLLRKKTVAVLGFKFLPWSVVSDKCDFRMIARFIAAEQRRQLRRNR